MKITRRDLIKLGLGTFALTVGGFSPLRAALAEKKIPLCLQLYTIGGAMRNNVEKTLEAVAEMGYDGVEFAGYHGRKPEELRKLLDSFGLICTGTHTGLGGLSENSLQATIDAHLALGAKFIIVPGMSHKGAAGWAAAGKHFTEVSGKVRPHGLYVGYHAHGGDFNKVDGGLSTWEIFADNSCGDVVLQNDLGHCVNAGSDPYALMEKYPGRSKTVHLKESDRKLIGEGRVDWKRAFKLCETIGGTEAYVVEYEGGEDRMEVSKKSCAAVKKMLGRS